MSHKGLERMTGIEPAYPAWKAGILPLNYIRRKASSCNSVLSLPLVTTHVCAGTNYSRKGFPFKQDLRQSLLAVSFRLKLIV